MSFLVSVPLPPQGFLRKKGAMGDDHLCFIINIWSVYNSDSHPPAHSVHFPLQRGTFIFFPTQRVGELNHFRLKIDINRVYFTFY